MAPAPRLSLIIPLYNVERHVSRLLNTLLRESGADFEAVIVNDASTDGSVGVVRGIVGDDPRFRLIANPVHSGVSAARNRGLAAATGDYVWFVDADDDLEPGSLQKIQEILGGAGECDVLTLIAGQFETDGESLVRTGEFSTFRSEDGCRSGREMARLLARQHRKLQGNVWLHVVRREFLLASGIRQLEGLSIGEDLLWSMQVFLHAAKVVATSIHAYRYITRPGSAMASYSAWTLAELYRCMREEYLVLEKIDAPGDDDLRRFFSSMAIDILIWWTFHPNYQRRLAKGIRWKTCADFTTLEANRRMIRDLARSASPLKRLGVWLILASGRLGTWWLCDLYFTAFFSATTMRARHSAARRALARA